MYQIGGSMDYYRKHAGYAVLKKKLYRRYEKDTVERIWDSANTRLEKLLEEYHDVPKQQKRHVIGNILPRIAMYYSMKEELEEDAMNLLEWTISKNGTKVGDLLHSLTALPGMKSLFMKVFKRMTVKMFGPSAGFKHTIYPTDKNELRFDITHCPYLQYCVKCGCPELTHTFCISDVYCYGNLSGIRFERTKTLGTGGDCCDFHLIIEKSENYV